MSVLISFNSNFPFAIGEKCHLDTDANSFAIPVWVVESYVLTVQRDHAGKEFLFTECDIVSNVHGSKYKDRVNAARLRPFKPREQPTNG